MDTTEEYVIMCDKADFLQKEIILDNKTFLVKADNNRTFTLFRTDQLIPFMDEEKENDKNTKLLKQITEINKTIETYKFIHSFEQAVLATVVRLNYDKCWNVISKQWEPII